MATRLIGPYDASDVGEVEDADPDDAPNDQCGGLGQPQASSRFDIARSVTGFAGCGVLPRHLTHGPTILHRSVPQVVSLVPRR